MASGHGHGEEMADKDKRSFLSAEASKDVLSACVGFLNPGSAFAEAVGVD